MPASESLLARPVTQVVDAFKTVEGGGIPIQRGFPAPGLSEIDPFLLLDHFGPVDYGPGKATGVPDHPHRGFETVTYMLEGHFQHRDSSGHSGVLGPGDVQWMTAGRGVIHSEMPTATMLREGGRMQGFQIWVNLPRDRKMTAPRYQDIPAALTPIAEAPGVWVRVIAGEALGRIAVIETATPILLLHFRLQAGAAVTQQIPSGYNVFAYVIDGEMGGACAGQLVLFGREGRQVELKTSTGAELLLLGGIPLNEPIARYGPFVMNTKAEIQQAFVDYRAGRLGSM